LRNVRKFSEATKLIIQKLYIINGSSFSKFTFLCELKIKLFVAEEHILSLNTGKNVLKIYSETAEPFENKLATCT